MKNTVPVFAALLLFIVFLTAPASADAQKKVSKLTISEKKFKRLSQKNNTVVLDVRTAEEYAEGHIGSSLNMDVQQEDFAANVKHLDRTKRYLLYCRSGKRSATALKILQDLGFKNVYHLAGGIQNWKGPVESDND